MINKAKITDCFRQIKCYVIIRFLSEYHLLMEYLISKEINKWSNTTDEIWRYHASTMITYNKKQF